MSKFWNQPMPDLQFKRMKAIIDAPSPVGLEAAMTYGVIKPWFEEIALEGWKIHQFKGSAGIVLDTHPGREDLLSVMVIGHSDKIRMQVRSIGEDGKIWVNTDSMLPQTLVGHEVILYSRDPENRGRYRAIEGGTVEALSAIHLAPPDLRNGTKGITSEMVYLELQMHGENPRQEVQRLGIATGDPIIFKRPLKRGFSPNTFYGAYLDNGLGCFVTAELAKLVAEHGGFENVRILFTIATHEEIGRIGSRLAAHTFHPDVLIGSDVSHDYVASPTTGSKRHPPTKMGSGFSIYRGAVGSETLNQLILQAAQEAEIPYQEVVAGRDFGTDGMAAALASIDSASTSIGFPIRNMHTISETGHTSDVLSAIAVLFETVKIFDKKRITGEYFKNHHPRLDQCDVLSHCDY